MKPSPLALEGYVVKELSVEVNPKFEKGREVYAWPGFHYQLNSTSKIEPVGFDVTGFAAIHKRERERRFYEITITSDRGPVKKLPYFFRITLEGYFRMNVEKGYPEDRAEVLFYALAPGLLFGAARELLAIITGRGPYPAVTLPAITFLDDAEKHAASTAKQLMGSTKQLTGVKVTKKLTGKKGAKKPAKKR